MSQEIVIIIVGSLFLVIALAGSLTYKESSTAFIHAKIRKCRQEKAQTKNDEGPADNFATDLAIGHLLFFASSQSNRNGNPDDK